MQPPSYSFHFFHQDPCIIPWENDNVGKSPIMQSLSSPAPKVNGMYPRLTPILHSSPLEIHSLVSVSNPADKPTNEQVDRDQQT